MSHMNPFTRFLARNSRDNSLSQLLEHCDALEALVIRVYKSKKATAGDEEAYAVLRGWFQANYHAWQERLKPYWQKVLAGGKTPAQDPIMRLLAAATAADFLGDWNAMQHLPAAREMLNQYVMNHQQ